MKYEGDWVADKREGKGVMTWPEGAKYEGDWVADQRAIIRLTETPK